MQRVKMIQYLAELGKQRVSLEMYDSRNLSSGKTANSVLPKQFNSLFYQVDHHGVCLMMLSWKGALRKKYGYRSSEGIPSVIMSREQNWSLPVSFGDGGHIQPESEIVTSHNPGSDQMSRLTQYSPASSSYEGDNQTFGPIRLPYTVFLLIQLGFRSTSPVHVQHSTKRVMFLSTKPIIHTIPPSKPVSLLTPVFLSEGEIDAVKKEANIQMNRLILDQTFFPTDDAALGRMAELALDKAIAKCSNADFSGWKLLREGQNEIKKLKGILTKIRNEIKDLILAAVVNAYSLSLAIEKRGPARLSPRIAKINLLLTTNVFLHGLMTRDHQRVRNYLVGETVPLVHLL
ncbi:uncharacterized protein EDB93DRAFT_1107432 [Suillus bovinus]|uniref:uncharacterized protein n=1 Tax=Suillus bovinus TaxID=48563 RepID=UPI001B8834C2|nr:uncharacterized protein EDB93DRAFT_1107432 [Suillus bovinus]KAG2134057.1 hypothetical protein EDB93DRAFT_1107432 [Suillus bovinus]